MQLLNGMIIWQMLMDALWSWISVESKEMKGRELGLYGENGTEDEGTLRSKWAAIQ